tara:strand:+ start:1663 stop:1806 length:144 start_codon:yes stop_codon:yes gene_type:complete
MTIMIKIYIKYKNLKIFLSKSIYNIISQIITILYEIELDDEEILNSG